LKILEKKLRIEYEEEKKKEVQDLYNALVDTISKHKAYRPHVVQALTLLLFEVLMDIHSEIHVEEKLSNKTPMSTQ